MAPAVPIRRVGPAMATGRGRSGAKAGGMAGITVGNGKFARSSTSTVSPPCRSA